MSSTGAEQGDAADQAYFLAVESAFLALRGKATLLSPEDWQAAREWRRTGIPVDFVIAVMESLFERQRERRSKRGISSLRYFRAAIAAAWDEQLAHRAGSAAPPADPGPPVAVRLSRLAAAVPETVDRADVLKSAITKLSGPLDTIEAELGELERGLLESLEAGLDDTTREEVARRVDQALAQAGRDLPAESVTALRESLSRQALRRQFRVPVLSLFSPAALGEPPPDAI